MLIGVTGRAQHGKDSIANRLVKGWGYTRLGFADSLKDLAYRVNPVLWDRLDGKPYRLAMLVDDVGWEEAKTFVEVRRFLQELGTQARAVLGPNVWVSALELKMLNEHTPVVIADVRFPNEAEFIHRHSGVLIRVHRYESAGEGYPLYEFENGVDPNHESEAHVPNLPANFEVFNEGTLEDLQAKVDEVMFALGVRA